MIETTQTTAKPRRERRLLPAELGVATVLVLLTGWLALKFPEFRDTENLTVIANGRAPYAIVAAGMLLVMATGGIDISVGSVLGLSGIVLGMLTYKGGSLWVGCLGALLTGALCGGLNGLLIARFKLPPIIATLATFSAARAGAYFLSKGESLSPLPEPLISLGYDRFLGVPRNAWVAIAVLVVIGLVLKRGRFGRSLLALGGNREAAYLSGLATRRTEITVYVLSGLLAGLASILVAAKASAASPKAGNLFELTAITAVALGGTSVTGGRATMSGTILGVLTIGVVENGVRSYEKEDIWVQLVLGLTLLAAVEVDRWRNRRQTREA